MSKTAKTVKKADTRATIKRVEKICTTFRADYHRRGVARFTELIEKHGLENIVVFPMTDEETERIKLAALVQGERTFSDYAKIAAMEMVRCDVEAFVTNLEQGKLKVIDGKAKR